MLVKDFCGKAFMENLLAQNKEDIDDSKQPLLGNSEDEEGGELAKKG